MKLISIHIQYYLAKTFNASWKTERILVEGGVETPRLVELHYVGSLLKVD